MSVAGPLSVIPSKAPSGHYGNYAGPAATQLVRVAIQSGLSAASKLLSASDNDHAFDGLTANMANKARQAIFESDIQGDWTSVVNDEMAYLKDHATADTYMAASNALSELASMTPYLREADQRTGGELAANVAQLTEDQVVQLEKNSQAITPSGRSDESDAASSQDSACETDSDSESDSRGNQVVQARPVAQSVIPFSGAGTVQTADGPRSPGFETLRELWKTRLGQNASDARAEQGMIPARNLALQSGVSQVPAFGANRVVRPETEFTSAPTRGMPHEDLGSWLSAGFGPSAHSMFDMPGFGKQSLAGLASSFAANLDPSKVMKREMNFTSPDGQTRGAGREVSGDGFSASASQWSNGNTKFSSFSATMGPSGHMSVTTSGAPAALSAFEGAGLMMESMMSRLGAQKSLMPSF